MFKKDNTQEKQTYEVFSYIQYVTTLFDRACMYINISYINMCKLNKNREWSKEWQRGVGGDGVCNCSLGELLDNKKQMFSCLKLHIDSNALHLFVW